MMKNEALFLKTDGGFENRFSNIFILPFLTNFSDELTLLGNRKEVPFNMFVCYS